MFFTRKRSKRWSTVEMCKFRMEMSAQLRDTYWDHAGNHSVCQSAMDQLPILHISKKADEAWIVAFVESIREVYSHATANLPELLFTDAQREEERKRYWTELSKMLNRVLPRFTQLPDARHPFSPVGRIACMLSYASLYSTYKTVAIEKNNLATVHAAAKLLNDIEQSEYSTSNDSEKNQIRMMFESIDLINILSNELPKKYDLLPPPLRRRSTAEQQKKAETPLSAHLRDFPKKFIEDLPKDEDKTEEEEPEEEENNNVEEPIVPRIIIMEPAAMIPAAAPSQASPPSRNRYYSSRFITIEEYADEIAAEAVMTALQHMIEERKVVAALEPISFMPAAPQAKIAEPSCEDSLQLSPFDPASFFRPEDKIERYGRRGLFDSPLPVIGRKKPAAAPLLLGRQHSTPSASESTNVAPEPVPTLLSPTYNQKLETKMIAAVLAEKPVSPMCPPPALGLDEFVVDLHL